MPFLRRNASLCHHRSPSRLDCSHPGLIVTVNLMALSTYLVPQHERYAMSREEQKSSMAFFDSPG